MIRFLSQLVRMSRESRTRAYVLLLERPTDGRFRYLPVMISRLMLSLKKAADLQETSRSLGQPSVSFDIDLRSMEFSHPQKGAKWREDGTSLDTHAEP